MAGSSLLAKALIHTARDTKLNQLHTGALLSGVTQRIFKAIEERPRLQMLQASLNGKEGSRGHNYRKNTPKGMGQ